MKLQDKQQQEQQHQQFIENIQKAFQTLKGDM
jgi:hypothetical protein